MDAVRRPSTRFGGSRRRAAAAGREHRRMGATPPRSPSRNLLKSRLATLAFTVIGLLIGVVGLLLPLYAFLTTIRPAQKAIRKLANLESRLEAKFDELLRSAESRRFEALFARIRSTDVGEHRDAAGRLANEEPHAFSDQHVALLHHALTAESDPATRTSMAKAALCRPSQYGDRIVTEILDGRLTGLGPQAFSYIGRTLKIRFSLEGQ